MNWFEFIPKVFAGFYCRVGVARLMLSHCGREGVLRASWIYLQLPKSHRFERRGKKEKKEYREENTKNKSLIRLAEF
jgi:hypothetical protein